MTTVRAPMRIGSIVRCGIAPWPPLPWIVTSTESTDAKAGPGVTPTCPAGRSGVTWRATAKEGRGKRVKRPSFSIVSAPAPFSSAGWPTRTSVPRQLPFARARSVAAPVQAVMWRSCPQACITGIGCPWSSLPIARLAYGRPVFSSTGRASRSVRSITTGPSPFARTPTTPVPPTFSVTSNPSARRRAASLAGRGRLLEGELRRPVEVEVELFEAGQASESGASAEARRGRRRGRGGERRKGETCDEGGGGWAHRFLHERPS